MKNPVMRYTFCFSAFLAVAMIVAMVGTPEIAAANVVAVPEVLVFHHADHSETVRLQADGQPVSGANMTGWRLLVEDRNYSHMLEATPTDTGLRITPSATVEIGSYILSIQTAQGEAQVQVYTPLSEQESLIESLAKRMDVSVDDVRAQMGMSKPTGREQITLNLMPVHYWGQRLVIDMPGASDRETVWKVNGEVVLEGQGENQLTYVLDETGPLLLHYEERQDGVVLAAAAALTEVSHQPSVRHAAHVDSPVQLQASPGFSQYAWYVDDVSAGDTALFAHRFTEPGEYEVRVLCEEPVTLGQFAMREDRYLVVITE